MPLLTDLGYGPEYLETKATVTQVKIGKGKGKKSYIPDYLAYISTEKEKPVLIIDAKHPNHSAEEGVNDAQLYASVIRRKMAEPKPEQYCIGVNGHKLILKHYDSDASIYELSFQDFKDDNLLFTAFKQAINRESLTRKQKLKEKEPKSDFEFRTVSPVELPAIFEACHRAIWKTEKRSPASAFYEFAKVMFVKIDEDKRLHEHLISTSHDFSSGKVPKGAVRFSVHWIEEMEEETDTDDPINTILFARLAKNLEEQIANKEKKRIFEPGELINLAPSTIKDAVRFLEHLDLYAVDEDLNGRLFETFLTATMRGEDLGQFFTPRSVVKFMVKLANLQAAPLKAMDMVLDGCCGTGGFLIEAMADMSHSVSSNRAITTKEQETLHRQLRTENLWGIDAGKDPLMARIARLNMLLHKDGGSRIYYADALDKQLRIESGLPLQTRQEIDELRSNIVTGDTRFSCVLSNPPFSMTYERKKPNEKAILDDYELSVDEKGKPRTSLRSSVMFLERYWDLLTDDGRLITIMDESVLNTLTSKPFREYLLEKFIIKGVIALPKNTFVKAQTAVKTSVLFLRKKTDPDERQPDIFMAICRNVGHSDSGKERPHLNELPNILKAFRVFQEKGSVKSSDQVFTVPDLLPNNPTLRIDAHYFNPKYFSTMKALDKMASDRGWKIDTLQDLLRESKTALAGGATPRGALYPDDGPKFIRVQNVKPNRLDWDSDDACIDTRTHTVTLKRSQLKEGDVVLTITGSYGIAAVVPAGFGEANINQHSVKIEVGDKIIPEYLSVFLNSNLCRPQFERAVTGSSRLALDYTSIRNLRILYPEDKDEQRRIANTIMKQLEAVSNLRRDATALDKAMGEVLTNL
ncbi:MAG TPA: N-6 DNA methylase [Pyrinomonadaceae bacterium]|jgi:type I restriction enzyme M protein